MELKNWRPQMKVDCGFGVSIEPIVRVEDGLEYSDYKIKNTMKDETN